MKKIFNLFLLIIIGVLLTREGFSGTDKTYADIATTATATSDAGCLGTAGDATAAASSDAAAASSDAAAASSDAPGDV